MNYGLIGDPITHSLSPSIHNRNFGALNESSIYHLYEDYSIEKSLKEFMEVNDIKGLNVTFPYKSVVLKDLNELTPISKQLGSVNTILRNHDQLIGHTTDGLGFIDAYKEMIIDSEHILLIGFGGACKPIFYELTKLNKDITIMKRNISECQYEPFIHDESISEVKTVEFDPNHVLDGYCLVVNTTPVGMNDEMVLTNFNVLPKYAIDIIYKPLMTPWLERMKLHGVTVDHGIGMLVHQAAHAYHFWTSRQARIDSMIEEVQDTLN